MQVYIFAPSSLRFPHTFLISERLRLEEEELQRLADVEKQRVELLDVLLAAEGQRLDAEK